METFKEYMRKFEGTDTFLRLLNTDIKRDKNFPNVNDKQMILNYLEKMKADTFTIKFFELAYKIYEVNESHDGIMCPLFSKTRFPAKNKNLYQQYS